MKTIDLSDLDNQPVEVREAIAFYTAQSVLPIKFTAVERAHYYGVLESAGYIEKMVIA